MSDPVLTLILIIIFFAAVAAARYFKTLDPDFRRAVSNPVIGGAIVGVLVRVIGSGAVVTAFLTGILLTLAGLYARLTGEESEPSDGMLLGSAGGAATAALLTLTGSGGLIAFAACVIAGAVAGYGVTFAAFHTANKRRQFVLDCVTAAAAVGGAFAPQLLARGGVPKTVIATVTACAIPALVVATVFKQWPDLRAELRHEASLGFMEDSDVPSTAHPFRRFGNGGWADAGAHREFVRLANRLALRKRQQRNRPEVVARVYQVELIKLRMQLQEMGRIDDATLRHRRGIHEEDPSDTMAHQ